MLRSNLPTSTCTTWYPASTPRALSPRSVSSTILQFGHQSAPKSSKIGRLSESARPSAAATSASAFVCSENASPYRSDGDAGAEGGTEDAAEGGTAVATMVSQADDEPDCALDPWPYPQ